MVVIIAINKVGSVSRLEMRGTGTGPWRQKKGLDTSAVGAPVKAE